MKVLLSDLNTKEWTAFVTLGYGENKLVSLTKFFDIAKKKDKSAPLLNNRFPFVWKGFGMAEGWFLIRMALEYTWFCIERRFA